MRTLGQGPTPFTNSYKNYEILKNEAEKNVKHINIEFKTTATFKLRVWFLLLRPIAINYFYIWQVLYLHFNFLKFLFKAEIRFDYVVKIDMGSLWFDSKSLWKETLNYEEDKNKSNINNNVSIPYWIIIIDFRKLFVKRHSNKNNIWGDIDIFFKEIIRKMKTT